MTRAEVIADLFTSFPTGALPVVCASNNNKPLLHSMSPDMTKPWCHRRKDSRLRWRTATVDEIETFHVCDACEKQVAFLIEASERYEQEAA